MTAQALVPAHSPIMAEKKLSGPAPHSLPLVSHQNGRIGSPSPVGPDQHSPVPSRTPASSPALRSLGTLRNPVTPLSSPGPDSISSSSRPRGQSLSSTLSSRIGSRFTRNKCQSSQQEEPEALLDLILESQGQRLEDQRASLSLLPDPGTATLCGACGFDQSNLDFYYMLIHYQSDRMEDQRCPLPDLDDAGVVPDGEESFFSLIQRVQSRRMDEQRASLTHSCRSTPCRHQHHPHQP